MTNYIKINGVLLKHENAEEAIKVQLELAIAYKLSVVELVGTMLAEIFVI